MTKTKEKLEIAVFKSIYPAHTMFEYAGLINGKRLFVGSQTNIEDLALLATSKESIYPYHPKTDVKAKIVNKVPEEYKNNLNYNVLDEDEMELILSYSQ